MKNVTVTVDDDTIAWARVEAAKAGKSLSRYVADMLAERRGRAPNQRESVERFLAGPRWALSENGRLPTKEALYADRLFHRHEHPTVRARSRRSRKASPGG